MFSARLPSAFPATLPEGGLPFPKRKQCQKPAAVWWPVPSQRVMCRGRAWGQEGGRGAPALGSGGLRLTNWIPLLGRAAFSKPTAPSPSPLIPRVRGWQGAEASASPRRKEEGGGGPRPGPRGPRGRRLGLRLPCRQRAAEGGPAEAGSPPEPSLSPRTCEGRL